MYPHNACTVIMVLTKLALRKAASLRSCAKSLRLRYAEIIHHQRMRWSPTCWWDDTPACITPSPPSPYPFSLCYTIPAPCVLSPVEGSISSPEVTQTLHSKPILFKSLPFTHFHFFRHISQYALGRRGAWVGVRSYATQPQGWTTDLNFPILDERPIDSEDSPKRM